MLGLPPLPRTLPAALRDAEHPRGHVRLSAMRDLVRHARGGERERAVPALIQRLLRDEEAEVRAEAAVALADADASEAVDALLGAARAGELRVRQMALLALGEVAPPHHAEALSLLEQSFRSEEPALRFQALIALHHLGSEAGEGAIIDALADGDAEIRAMAFRCAEERWLGDAIPARILAAARRALEDDDRNVRLCAAILLANQGDKAGSAVLLDVAAGSLRVGTEADQQAAIELCARLELEGARPALERRAFGPFGLRGDSLAWHARTALARLGDPRAKLSILRGLRAWTRDARTLSVVAAAHSRLSEALPIISAMQGDAARADPEVVAEALAALTRPSA